MSVREDEMRKAELLNKCLKSNNQNDGGSVREKLDAMRTKSKGQDKVLINMMLSDSK